MSWSIPKLPSLNLNLNLKSNLHSLNSWYWEQGWRDYPYAKLTSIFILSGILYKIYSIYRNWNFSHTLSFDVLEGRIKPFKIEKETAEVLKQTMKIYENSFKDSYGSSDDSSLKFDNWSTETKIQDNTKTNIATLRNKFSTGCNEKSIQKKVLFELREDKEKNKLLFRYHGLETDDDSAVYHLDYIRHAFQLMERFNPDNHDLRYVSSALREMIFSIKPSSDKWWNNNADLKAKEIVYNRYYEDDNSGWSYYTYDRSVAPIMHYSMAVYDYVSGYWKDSVRLNDVADPYTGKLTDYATDSEEGMGMTDLTDNNV